jgi:hypothetical protein
MVRSLPVSLVYNVGKYTDTAGRPCARWAKGTAHYSLALPLSQVAIPSDRGHLDDFGRMLAFFHFQALQLGLEPLVTPRCTVLVLQIQLDYSISRRSTNFAAIEDRSDNDCKEA